MIKETSKAQNDVDPDENIRCAGLKFEALEITLDYGWKLIFSPLYSQQSQ